MMKIVKNKKAEVGDTLVLILTIFSVVFIFIFLISTVLFIITKEKIKFWDEENRIAKGEVQPKTDLIATINLISFLETNVSDVEMEDLILLSLDPYIENEISLDTLHVRRPFFGEILVVTKQKDELLFKESQNILGKVCKDYMLKVPQGVIKPGEEDFVPEDDFLSTEWTPWSEIKISYVGQIVEIKYKQLKKC